MRGRSMAGRKNRSGVNLCWLVIGTLIVLRAPAAAQPTVTVSYDAAVTFAAGPHAPLFHQGDQFHFSYNLDPAVPDTNTSPLNGIYRNAVRSMSVSLAVPGVSVVAGPAGTAQTFNNVVDSSSGLVSDQAFFF